MRFAIVIATRNRLAALQLSLPLMLAQGRLPAQLIIVDASDNHEEVRASVETMVAGTGAEFGLRVVRSAAGSAYQRNVGLEYVETPVVFFPDDDALWFPHLAEEIMRIYERDNEEMVGGVGPLESSVPPPGVPDSVRVKSSMELRDRLQLAIGPVLDSLEYRFLPDPLFMEGRAKYEDKRIPAWMADAGSKPANVFAGFRMSFRTDAIRRTGFDDALGRYALFEDYDACLGVLKDRVLVDALKARAFHFRGRGKRVDGIEWGVIQILNRAYVVCKHSPPGSPARRRLLAYSYYKLARYLMQAHTAYGRQRVRGVARALPLVGECLAARQDELK